MPVQPYTTTKSIEKGTSEKVLPGREDWAAILSMLRSASNDSNNELSNELTSSEYTDKSGNTGPFGVSVREGSADGEADRVVVGSNRSTVDLYTTVDGSTEDEVTVPKSKGRATVTPGIIIVPSGVLVCSSEDVISLWPEGDTSESPSDYETELLYLDLQNWDGSSSIDSTYYSWAATPLSSSFKDLLSRKSSYILPLAFVAAKNAFESGGDTLPRQVVQIFGLVSEPIVNLKGGSAAVLVKTTGAPTAGVYPVDFYEDGKNEDSTGSGELQVLSLNISESLPTGTWLMAYQTEIEELT